MLSSQEEYKESLSGWLIQIPVSAARAIKILKSAGIAVEVGILEDESKKLNEPFIKYITRNIPFVILKTAATLDGKIATASGDSKWITGEESRRLVHKIRSEVDAVMVGIGTVIADDPLLTVRLYKSTKKDPFRIIVDSNLRIPLDRQMLRPELAEHTIIATMTKNLKSGKAHALQKLGAQVLGVSLKKGRIDLSKLLTVLGKKGDYVPPD